MFPFELMKAAAVRCTVMAQYEGIQIAQISLSDAAPFVRDTVRSLELIRNASPRHFGMIREHGAFIANAPLSFAAEYTRFSRLVSFDFNRCWVDSEREKCLRLYAMMLVHEATHGYLENLCFAYTKATRSRIERICENEANRLLLHFGDAWSHLRVEFDETKWSFSWHAPRWQRSKQPWKRIRKDWRDNPD